MKQFQLYRSIRKRAVIFGLPLPLFAIMIMAIVASLLVIIFSFSVWVILVVLMLNMVLYLTLNYWMRHPQSLYISTVYPKIISNKRNTGLEYEKD